MFNPLVQELSVRTDMSGGRLTSTVETGPDHGALGHSRAVILIHGYNNDVTSARGSYALFVNNLVKNWSKGRVLLPDTFRFFWPGDESWSVFSFLSFPLEIEPAQKSASLLAAYFRGLSGPSGGIIDIYVIAHSLGNRLVMELFQTLAGGSLPAHVQVKGACLMAAAVPVSKADVGGDLHSGATFTPAFTLYSTGDSVLHFAFPTGETAAGDALFPTSVGRQGQPQSQWSFTQQMVKQGSKKLYSHSDYWTDEATSAPVARFLDPSLPKPPAVNALGGHLTPPPNALPQTTIAARSLPNQPSFG